MPPNRTQSILLFTAVSIFLICWLVWGVYHPQTNLTFEQLITSFTQVWSNAGATQRVFTPQEDSVLQDAQIDTTSTDQVTLITPPTIRRPEATSSAQVRRVVDGDTIELADGRTVRYIGVDTPETKHPNKTVECYGLEAEKQNTLLVMGKTVVLERDVSETDRYGRLLRYVWVDGQQVNWQLVANGYAFAKSYPPDIANQDAFIQGQRLAQKNQLGLWAHCDDK